MRALAALAFLALPLAAETAADLARAIRENSLDRDECYRVRDLTLSKEDIRIYLGDGHLIFSKPVDGRRIAAFFTADVEEGDAEVILMPPDLAERRSLAAYVDSPTLDEHFRTAAFLFTGNEYDDIKAQFPKNPANRKVPEIGAALDEEFSPVLRNLTTSYQERLVYELLNRPAGRPGLFAGLLNNAKLGNFDVLYDPDSAEQIMAGQVKTTGNRLTFDTWTSFRCRSARANPAPPHDDLATRDYRIEATVNPDLSLSAVTRVKVTPLVNGLAAAAFDISGGEAVVEVKVDGRPAEVLESDSLRVNATRGGNKMFLVVPAEPLRAGRDYEFEFHHSGKVILDAGDRVLYVNARDNWYPLNGVRFTSYDLLFRYPRDLDLVTPGEIVEDRTDGEWRITRRRTSAPIRVAAFNLGNYAHARFEHGGYAVDVCANRTLENALRPRLQEPITLDGTRGMRGGVRPGPLAAEMATVPAQQSPTERLRALASEVEGALEFMVSRFGPPALPHVTVSPIPGAFGQGFPGLIYLSTLAYLKNLPGGGNGATQADELFFADLLQAHEMAHQWWGNRVTAASYRDHWLMESLANYSALLYLEKTRGARYAETMLENYRKALLAKDESGDAVESAGPIALGMRLESSQAAPRAWRTITYGKGTWIMQMLRRRMGDARFFAMLAEVLKRYDRKEISTDDFRRVAADFLPPDADDRTLEGFFDEWVDGTGIPSLKLTYKLRGKAPAIQLTGTLAQSDVSEDFSVAAPVEIQLARGRTVTQWVRSGSTPATFTVALKSAPVKVLLDPHNAVLRK
jgi:hypothetical protein